MFVQRGWGLGDTQRVVILIMSLSALLHKKNSFSCVFNGKLSVLEWNYIQQLERVGQLWIREEEEHRGTFFYIAFLHSSSPEVASKHTGGTVLPFLPESFICLNLSPILRLKLLWESRFRWSMILKYKRTFSVPAILTAEQHTVSPFSFKNTECLSTLRSIHTMGLRSA